MFDRLAGIVWGALKYCVHCGPESESGSLAKRAAEARRVRPNSQAVGRIPECLL